MGLAKLKAKLRAWLIELVREAIRSEFPVVRDSVERAVMVEGKVPIVVHVDPKKSANTDATHIAPSFEQLQAEALAAQEKFYEPERA